MFIPHAQYSCMLQKYNYSMQCQICPMSPEIQHNIDMSILFMYIHILPISIGYFHLISFGLLTTARYHYFGSLPNGFMLN